MPDLAESWDISSDGLTYTFHLRPQVTWHDGEPFGADDVVFTYDAMQDPNFHGEPALEELFRSVTVTKVDDVTVTLRLTQPFAPLLARLAVGILPAHLLGSLDADALYSGPFNQQPVGTGPFRLTDISAERAVLDANPAYYAGKPNLDRFELRFYPDEPSLLKALKDGAARQRLLPFAPRQRPICSTWRAIPPGRCCTCPRQRPPSSTSTTPRLPLQDKKVRQALAYATDRASIIAAVLGNQAVQADSAIPAGTWAYYAVLDRYPFDPVQAAKLLDEEGWLMGPNGMRARDGQELRLSIVTNEDAQRLAIAAGGRALVVGGGHRHGRVDAGSDDPPA